jgi:integrase/recombinase XerD
MLCNLFRAAWSNMIGTLSSYLPIVRRFLSERFGNKAVRLEELRPRDLHRFILRQVPRGSRNYAKLMVTALRSFLGFLFQRGAIKTDLPAASITSLSLVF